MGTDIHGVFQRQTASGAWEDIPSTYKQERHYMLFAWLGNVRNGFGFSGVPTHSEIAFLSDCRGYPPGFDVVDDDHPIKSLEVMDPRRREWYSPEEDAELGRTGPVIWMGDHSHSWVTADEVLSAKLPRVIKTGVVERAAFEVWDGVSEPQTWSGMVSGQNVVLRDSRDLIDPPAATHVRIRWFKDMAEEFKEFIDEVWHLVGLYGTVRFVFGFDS